MSEEKHRNKFEEDRAEDHISPDAEMIAAAIKLTGVKKAADGLAFKNAQMYTHPLSTKVELLHFVKIGESGATPGIKLKIVKNYGNGCQKSHLGGVAMRKRGSWIWSIQTKELANILKEKKLNKFLQELNSDEKTAIKKLENDWEQKFNT